MNNFKDSILYVISIFLVVIVMMLSMLFEKGFAFQIFGPEDVFKIVLGYIVLGLITYQILKGIIVSDKSRMIRNIGILLIGNVLIYSIMFFSNPNTQMEYFFHQNAINYFIGYFIFSLCASFVGSSFFYEYRNEITLKGFHPYVIWRYFIESLVSILALYFVFCQFVNKFFPNEIFYNNVINYLLVGSITSIFLTIFYFLEKKRNSFEKEIIQQSTKAEKATANFETLKNQLDPHFLFNSLNVLTGLIEENPDKAIDFTTSLSKIYRYLLEQKDKEVVPLSEEINFAKTYIKLLKLRFENSIDFELDVYQFPENEFIIPLALQILLENTIKHNIVSESKPLKIRMYKEGQHLIVENSLQLKTSVKDSTGVGLNNIKNRYQLISNQRIDIQQTEENFSVKLPILSQKINIEPEDNLDYEEAKDKVKALKKFYINLFWNLLAIGISFYYLNQLKFSIIVSLFILYNIFTEWIKVNGIEENWEERKAHEFLEKKKQSKK